MEVYVAEAWVLSMAEEWFYLEFYGIPREYCQPAKNVPVSLSVKIILVTL